MSNTTKSALVTLPAWISGLGALSDLLAVQKDDLTKATGNAIGERPGCPPDKLRFFINTTLSLMLTQAVKEGGWIKEHLDHNQPLNNPFGVNRINGKRQASGNVAYSSLDAAIQDWERRYGDRIRGVQTPDDYIDKLEHPTNGQPYNAKVDEYTKDFKDDYDSVLKYMKLCGVQQ
jgi:hypothetical protein